MLESALFPNLLYLALVAGIWLAALAVVSPGTGVLELLAFFALGAAGLGTLVAPLNSWALLILLLGVIFFVLSLRVLRPEIGLVLAALAFSAGSVYLFRPPQGIAGVDPVLAVVVSGLTLGYFWYAVRKTYISQLEQPTIDIGHVIGKTAEVRTTLDPLGSVYALGELWTARSDTRIKPGAQVKITGREGLILIVEPLEASG
jgi:membrane-bound serine protease (ClpP class)